MNGYHPPPPPSSVSSNHSRAPSQSQTEDVIMANGTEKPGTEDENTVEEVTQPPPIETPDSINFKLEIIQSYLDRVKKRVEAKALMFDRGLTDYKKVCHV
jgi:transcriptional adapter 2-alpha